MIANLISKKYYGYLKYLNYELNYLLTPSIGGKEGIFVPCCEPTNPAPSLLELHVHLSEGITEDGQG